MLQNFEVELIFVDGAAVSFILDLTTCVPLMTVLVLGGEDFVGVVCVPVLPIVDGGGGFSFGIAGARPVIEASLSSSLSASSGTSVAGGVPAGRSTPGSAAMVVAELGIDVDGNSVSAKCTGGADCGSGIGASSAWRPCECRAGTSEPSSDRLSAESSVGGRTSGVDNRSPIEGSIIRSPC